MTKANKKFEAKPKGMADNIPVYCSFDEILETKSLVPNPQNPNKHPEEQILLLAKVIQNNGWRAPITVSTLSGMIVKGHGRLKAAEMLGVKEVPVDFQCYEKKEDELADLMADNRISELSKIEKRKLLNLFEEFDNGTVEFETCGYKPEEYESLCHQFDEFFGCQQKVETDETEEPQEDKETVELSKTATCPNCGYNFEVRK